MLADTLFFFFSVLSSVPTSGALLLCHSSHHPHLQPHPRLIPHRGPSPDVHRRRCQIIGGLPSEEDTALLPSHFGGVACSDSTYAGHSLLYPPTGDNVSSLRCRVGLSEHPLKRADRYDDPPPIHLSRLSDTEGFDQNYLRQARRRKHSRLRSP